MVRTSLTVWRRSCFGVKKTKEDDKEQQQCTTSLIPSFGSYPLLFPVLWLHRCHWLWELGQTMALRLGKSVLSYSGFKSSNKAKLFN